MEGLMMQGVFYIFGTFFLSVGLLALLILFAIDENHYIDEKHKIKDK